MSVYRLKVRYQSEGTGDAGALMLGSVQVRRGSERVVVDGVPLVRDVDYRVDYDLGRVSFARPDTLFNRQRAVTVRFEDLGNRTKLTLEQTGFDSKESRDGHESGWGQCLDLLAAQEINLERVLVVDAALQELAKFSPRQSQIVEMRFFGGLTEDEIALVLELSERTVKRDWA